MKVIQKHILWTGHTWVLVIMNCDLKIDLIMSEPPHVNLFIECCLQRICFHEAVVWYCSFQVGQFLPTAFRMIRKVVFLQECVCWRGGDRVPLSYPPT